MASSVFFNCFRNIHLDTPYKIDRMPNQLHYTYLDTFGRPVLVATKNNLVEHHIQDLVVRRFTRSAARDLVVVCYTPLICFLQPISSDHKA